MAAPAGKSFAHLHVHTEYSMLDGAAKNGKLFAEAERQGMPAIAMSDHGNCGTFSHRFSAGVKRQPLLAWSPPVPALPPVT